MGRKTKPKLEILNPRYAGATPEMVGRALLRQAPKEAAEPKSDEASNIIADPEIQSSI